MTATIETCIIRLATEVQLDLLTCKVVLATGHSINGITKSLLSYAMLCDAHVTIQCVYNSDCLVRLSPSYVQRE